MTTAEAQKVAPRLKLRYRSEIRDALQQQFDYANVMQVPTVAKVVINIGSQANVAAQHCGQMTNVITQYSLLEQYYSTQS